jgi:Family of unknown function (DUF6492)
MLSNKLSFVLPITLKENLSKLKWRVSVDQFAELRFKLLIRTFLHNFNLQDLDMFLIVCPKEEVEFISIKLKMLISDNRFIIIDEEDIFPEFKNNISIQGWYKQQIIKFAIAKHIKTDYYLTLDSDVVCKKHFSYSDLIITDKAYVNIETKLDYTELYRSQFASQEWKIKSKRLKRSSALLNYNRKYRYRKQSYGETPVLLHRKSVLDLLKELTLLHKDWFKTLSISTKWTEYTLYFQYLEKHDLLNKLYIQTGRSTILDMDYSIWHLPDYYLKKRNFTPEYILGGNGFFVVIQSCLDEQKWMPKSICNVIDYYR